MSDFLHTKKRDYQYNGPVDSADYNSRIEENYKDLVYLYNKANIVDQKLASAFERVLKDQKFLSNAINDLADRVRALEAGSNQMSIYSFSQLDFASFVTTSFAIGANDLLSFDPIYNIITLPKISSSSYSKLKFYNQAEGQVVPDFFKAKVDVSFSGVDGNGALVDMTPLYNCILDAPDKVWRRNIIANAPSAAGAQMMLYVKIPVESVGSLKTNCLKINPYPMFGCDITSIEYTTKANPTLSNADGWFPLNRRGLYDSEPDAIGKVAPGGWSVATTDASRNSGPLGFVFPDVDITAIRIKFVQRNYFIENGKYIYTYGLSDLDIRYDKYLPTGKTMVKFTPSVFGDVISEVTNVTPKIFNVPQSLISSAFSYRILYDDGSGNFTDVNPGANSSIWVEVTLNMLDDSTAPVLSDLIIDYI